MFMVCIGLKAGEVTATRERGRTFFALTRQVLPQHKDWVLACCFVGCHQDAATASGHGALPCMIMQQQQLQRLVQHSAVRMHQS